MNRKQVMTDLDLLDLPIGYNVSALMRDYLVKAGIPYDTALQLSMEFNEQIALAEWLETYETVVFEFAYQATHQR